MSYDPNRHHRRSIRCTDTMITDAFMVMPDHIHGIIVIAAPGDVGHVDAIVAINAGG